jgi:hypothetical protein
MAGHRSTSKSPPMAAGQRYGRLVALTFVGRSSRGIGRWRFRCDCGKKCALWTNNVRNGHTRSCGCWRRERSVQIGRQTATHRMTGLIEHRAWTQLRNRCQNSRNKDYKEYGGRGIKVCKRWEKFENFYADMGPRPSVKHSLDRHPDNDGDYKPSNCRWATKKQQRRNQRRSKMVRYQGRRMTLAEACDLSGVRSDKARLRLRRGWSVKRALVP